MKHLLKKITLGFAIVALGSTSLMAQDSDDKEDSAPKYQFGIDVYHGTPMFFQWLVKTAVSSGLADSYKNEEVTLGGPFGVRGEFNINDEFSIGLDLGYNSVKASAKRTETLYNSSTNSNYEVQYTDEFRSSKIGAVITFNLRLYETERFQASGVIGVGYGVRKFAFNSNDPQYDSETYGFGDNLFNAPVYPVSFRIGLITRYYFTDNIGLNLGLGIGQGGLLNAGLSFRM
jgi:opacity protein-like surface antigen